MRFAGRMVARGVSEAREAFGIPLAITYAGNITGGYLYSIFYQSF